MFCRPYGTRFHSLGAYPGLTSWAIVCRPAGAVSAVWPTPFLFLADVMWLTEVAPVFAVFGRPGISAAGRLSFCRAYRLVSSRSVVSHPSKIAKGGAASVVVVPPVGEAARTWDHLKCSVVPPGLGSSFCGLTQDLRPGLLSAAPPGLSRNSRFGNCSLFILLIFLPLTFLSCRIET